ncbi:unnamed protein product, partial [Dicrocoelium dendriticum]
MPKNKKPSVDANEDMKESRQVQNLSPVGDTVSCSGSHSSRKSNARVALRLAELKRQQAETELEMARLRLEMEENVDCPDHLTVSNYVPDVGVDRMNQFLNDCQETVPPIITPMSYHQPLPVACRTSLDLPKVELEFFDGNPTAYWRFIKQFEYFVETRVSDGGQRLLYLVYYCKGRAKEAISECVMLPPEQAYHKARSILRELFGQCHVVARSLIEGLLTGLRPLDGDHDALSRLSIKLDNCYVALSQMNFTADLDSVATIERIVRVLPNALQTRWARTADSIVQDGRDVVFKDLADFVATEARIARSRFGQIATPVAPRQLNEARQRRVFQDKGSGRNFALYTTLDTPKESVCLACGDPHSTSSCAMFAGLDVSRRWDLVRDKGGCYNCLEIGHRAASCRVSKGCSLAACKKRHHSLLHNESIPKTPEENLSHCHNTGSTPGKVSLGVVPVRLVGPLRSIETYALIDSGSDISLVQEDILREAGVEIEPASLKMQTVNACTSLNVGLARFQLFSLNGSDSVLVDHAYCLSHLPLQPVTAPVSQLAEKWPHLMDVKFDDLSDPRVRILLGADVPEAHWQFERRDAGRKRPFAVKTLLGWTLLGPVGRSTRQCASVNFVHSDDIPLEGQLKVLFDSGFERVGSSSRSLSGEDKTALCIVESSVRLVDGHYEIALPWRSHNANVPNNYEAARRRLDHLSKRLSSDPSLRER